MGYSVGRRSIPQPQVIHDTIEIYDPYWHNMADSIADYHNTVKMALEGKIKRLEGLSSKVDTIYLPTPQDVSNALISSDTLSMLQDYLSIKNFTWEKQDSDLNVILHTVISQNRPVGYNMYYQITKPTTVINSVVDNSVTYNKYLQLGVGIPTNAVKLYDINTKLYDYLNVDLHYVYRKGYLGVEFYPVVGVLGVKAGMTLFKF
jgi:hypothetical protein